MGKRIAESADKMRVGTVIRQGQDGKGDRGGEAE